MAISIRPYKASDAKTLTNLFRDSVRAIPRAITLGALTARDVSAEEGDDSAIEVTMKSYTSASGGSMQISGACFARVSLHGVMKTKWPDRHVVHD
jgi:hypothetical protein